MEPSCRRCKHDSSNRGYLECGKCLLSGLDKFEPSRKALQEENNELRAELARLRSAPVEVRLMIPDWETIEDYAGVFPRGSVEGTREARTMRRVYDYIEAHALAVPSDRVLKEGDVVASKDDLALLLQDACRYSGGDDDAWDPEEVVRRLQVVRERNALRSQRAAKGGAA